MSILIHMHLEVKKDGKWFYYAAPDIPRDAAFFDLVSGVCLQMKPVASPRGLPSGTDGGVSEVTRMCYETDRRRYRLHHAGWLGSHDLAGLQHRLDEHYGNSGKADCQLESGYLHTSLGGGTVAGHRDWDDSRLVFWFHG